MIAKIYSGAIIGIEAHLVEVEVDISNGLPSFTTVGLPETAVKESKERVKSAIHNSGYSFPDDRITVNLAPANIKKDGTGFDLPMALCILAATGVVPYQKISRFCGLGELSLDGRIKPVKGSLPMAITAREVGLEGLFVAAENGREASVVHGIAVYPVSSLHQIVDFLKGTGSITPQHTDIKELFTASTDGEMDYAEVFGQEHAKRAIEIAAAGAHNILMMGPPGSGKTMLARRLPTILPPLTFEEALDTTKIYSIVGMLEPDQALVTKRPFRSPHHTVSDAGLIGGGHVPRPGEISLAHNGVLFLDELSEFKKHVLEVLRQPLEDATVTISRAVTSISYPARFMLVAALNPCPCGFLGDPKHECHCTRQQIHRHRSKISGPLLDRVDLQVEVPAVPYKDFKLNADMESSATIRNKVIAARQIQLERFSKTNIRTNAHMKNRHLQKFCKIDQRADALLETAIDKFGFSARTFNRVLKISRTIADLDGSQDIDETHIYEAIQYRNFERKWTP